MTTVADPQPEIAILPEPGQTSTRLELRLEGQAISRLWIVPFTLRIGAAAVRMDGIGGVGTDEAHRNRGYSRRVLEAAVEQMTRGDAALSMLYGIRDFYPKFGYATAGPDHLVLLTDPQRDFPLPAGWTVRPVLPPDVPAIQALYAHSTANGTGAAIRMPESSVWSNLKQAAQGMGKDACRVVLNPAGSLRGYLWRARWCWYVHYKLETDYKDALVLGEVMADGPIAADAVLAACCAWAGEGSTGRRSKRVVLAFPPEGPLAAAAMRQDARFLANYSACGGSMARLLSLPRLLAALRPELKARLASARYAFTGSLHLRTETEAACLRFTHGDIRIVPEPLNAETSPVLQASQSDIARLALGAFPPKDLLVRLPEVPSEETARLLEILFPKRQPHMYLPDRY